MTPLHCFCGYNVSKMMPSNTSLHTYGDDDTDSEANSKESFETKFSPNRKENPSICN